MATDGTGSKLFKYRPTAEISSDHSNGSQSTPAGGARVTLHKLESRFQGTLNRWRCRSGIVLMERRWKEGACKEWKGSDWSGNENATTLLV